MGLLDGKVVIVTGATSGIGERIARHFAEEGASVVGAGRRETEGAVLAQHTGATFLRTDVTLEDEVRRLVAFTIERFGQLDRMINNAGSSAPDTSIAEFDMACFNRVMSVNIRGVVLGMKHAAAAMLPRGAGSIVNISSVAASQGGFTGHAYTASKAAVLDVTRSAATELGGKGIRVNAISPGGIVTGIFGKNAGLEGSQADRVSDAVRDVFSKLQPVQRAGETLDIAHAAAFLASDMSGFVNGHAFVVDGGLSVAAMGWEKGLALRANLNERVKMAAARG
ncbi:glucose 1-dehydrogenase [Belnapia moabensis]|uniref:glucose 1-dehydrogenase n=1 Tax=Belnapia moabensis TaxID=365533 RepID=UPI0005BA504A|nr:glucose 1-dehydrogenase [Belnapia moabensis]